MKLVNQQLIKNTNLKQIYNEIYWDPGISRSQLAKKLHLSKTAVSTLVDELILRNYIYDSGTGDSSTVGRRPNHLFLRQEQYYTVVISLKEDYIDAQLVDITGASTFISKMPVNSAESYLLACYEYVHNQILFRFDKEQILGICIVIPAMIDPETEEIVSSTLPLSGNGFLKNLRKTFPDFAVAVLNDTACLAYSEKVYTQLSEPDFAFINFEKGIGAALFIQNKMLGRACASYTQFGHYSIDPHGPLCSCGGRGCLELMIGEESLKKRVEKAGNSAALRQLSHITYEDLGQASMYGDVTSRKVIHDIAVDFSYALCNLICLVHPRLIIIGGKGKGLGPFFLQEIRNCLKTTGFRKMVDSVDVCYSQLDSGALYNGAMKYFFDIHFSFAENNDMDGSFFIG